MSTLTESSSDYDNVSDGSLLIKPQSQARNQKNDSAWQYYCSINSTDLRETLKVSKPIYKNISNCCCMTDSILGIKNHSVNCLTISPRPYKSLIELGKISTLVTCPSCRNAVHTKVVYENTPMSIFLCCMLGPFALCAIPECVIRNRIARHYCPVCGAYIGSF